MQNKSLHLYFTHLANELNNAGYSVTKTIRHDIDIDWTPVLIKELIWKTVQKSAYNKKSTADLTSGELQIIWETINRYVGEKFGIHIPFPSLQALVDEEKNKRNYQYPQHDEEPNFDIK